MGKLQIETWLSSGMDVKRMGVSVTDLIILYQGGMNEDVTNQLPLFLAN